MTLVSGNWFLPTLGEKPQSLVLCCAYCFFCRFLHDTRLWAVKTVQERNVVIDKYYSFIPQSQPITTVFNVPRQAERKPSQRKKRTSSTKTRKKK